MNLHLILLASEYPDNVQEMDKEFYAWLKSVGGTLPSPGNGKNKAAKG